MNKNSLIKFLNKALLTEELDITYKIANLLEVVSKSDLPENEKNEIIIRLKILLNETNQHAKSFSKLIGLVIE